MTFRWMNLFFICSSLDSRIGESVSWIPQKSKHQIVINGQQSNDGLLKYIGNQFHLYLIKEISKNWTLEKLPSETEQEITVSQNMIICWACLLKRNWKHTSNYKCILRKKYIHKIVFSQTNENIKINNLKIIIKEKEKKKVSFDNLRSVRSPRRQIVPWIFSQEWETMEKLLKSVLESVSLIKTEHNNRICLDLHLMRIINSIENTEIFHHCPNY